MDQEPSTPARVRVYDPALCCPTGVCGPAIDPALIRFTMDLQWLTDNDVEVARFNLGQEPEAFVAAEQVTALLTEKGDGALPAVFIDGRLIASGAYPYRAELAEALGLAL